VTRLLSSVEGTLPQELFVDLCGADVLKLAPHAPAEQEAPIPDLADLFARAARLGFFGGTVAEPWGAVAEVLASEVRLVERRASFRLRLDAIDPGALRVLWNVLGARDLEEASMRTVPKVPGKQGALLDPGHLAYPGLHRPLPFALEAEPPARSSRERAVQLVFQRPPPDEVVDEVLAALGVFTELLLLGGYPEDGQDPRDSGAFPDPAFQLDEVTVEQAFPELFAADQAAFHAVVNHAMTLDRRGHPLSVVVVR